MCVTTGLNFTRVRNQWFRFQRVRNQWFRDLRAVVTLFYYEDLSIREISAVLGISEAAVKTRLSRGRSRLKQLLHEE